MKTKTWQFQNNQLEALLSGDKVVTVTPTEETGLINLIIK